MRFGEGVEEVLLEAVAKKILRQLQRPSGIHDDLNSLDAGEFVEEPAAACVHEHGVALHFEQLQRRSALLRRELMLLLFGKEAVEAWLGAIKNDIDVAVTHKTQLLQE